MRVRQVERVSYFFCLREGMKIKNALFGRLYYTYNCISCQLIRGRNAIFPASICVCTAKLPISMFSKGGIIVSAGRPTGSPHSNFA